jgi:hypothetical protein
MSDVIIVNRVNLADLIIKHSKKQQIAVIGINLAKRSFLMVTTR